MQGLGYLVVCALVASCVAENNTTQAPPAQNGYYPFPFVHPFQAVAQSVQAQRGLSEQWASLLLRFQSFSGWSQVSHGWLAMIQQDAAESKSSLSLEEDEDMTPLMFTAPSANTPEAYDALERSTEQALLTVLKIMYIQAGHKLSQTQESHFQNKLYLSAVQQTAGAQLGPVLSIMYYIESLRVLSSAYTIQRQDAWNTWLIYEILETDVLDNSRTPLPAGFSALMVRSQLHAMTTYYHEASTDLQITYLEYYLQMIVSSLIPRGNANNAANAASFLEEEATAEPSKPFFPFMAAGMAGSNPFMMNYYNTFLKMYSAFFNYHAAEGLFHYAVIQDQAESGAAAGPAVDDKVAAQLKTYAISSLGQWAYLELTRVMIEFQTFSYSMMAAAPHGAAHANANANAFVQTEAAPAEPAAPAVPEVTPEQKALLDSVVSQFLRPQSLPASQ